MRVIAGRARGHQLNTLPGTDTRPTTDRVKEAVFSMIQAYIPDSHVLDLFAGSGALGIEALSRGAAFCDFVEQSHKAAEIVKQNLTKTRLLDLAALHILPAHTFLSSTVTNYSLIFLDPPYHQQLCGKMMDMLYEKALLDQEGLIVCETAADEEIQTLYTLWKQKTYGKIKISIYR